MVALSVSPSLVLKDILVTLFSLYKILYPFVVYFGMCVVDVVVVVAVVVVIVVVVFVFVTIYRKSKVEVCFSLLPLDISKLVIRCPYQIKGTTLVCSNKTNSIPNVRNG